MRSPCGIPPFLARGLLDMGGLNISEIVWIKVSGAAMLKKRKISEERAG
jgi:hypothetical protein